jgi:hypothetical protein
VPWIRIESIMQAIERGLSRPAVHIIRRLVGFLAI